MCKAETDLEKMQLTQVEKPDPATQQRPAVSCRQGFR
jgi:hypothetical protein